MFVANLSATFKSFSACSTIAMNSSGVMICDILFVFQLFKSNQWTVILVTA